MASFSSPCSATSRRRPKNRGPTTISNISWDANTPYNGKTLTPAMGAAMLPIEWVRITVQCDGCKNRNCRIELSIDNGTHPPNSFKNQSANSTVFVSRNAANKITRHSAHRASVNVKTWWKTFMRRTGPLFVQLTFLGFGRLDQSVYQALVATAANPS